jgi:hypothetical protein
LDPSGYGDFYDHSFPVQPPGALPLEHIAATPPWSAAPRAAFPTYSFSVKNGASFNLALPVSGVPVGLGLMGAKAAEGTISISKARTLGIDTLTMFADLQEWASREAAFLASFGAQEPKNFVRIVTRVYLTGALDVSLRDSSQAAFGLDAGSSVVSKILDPDVPASASETPEAAAKNYQKAIETLNESLAKLMPSAGAEQQAGGSLRVTSAGARTISLREEFDPPLVLGYLGFDCAILPGGLLGPPVPTHAVLTREEGAAWLNEPTLETAFPRAAFFSLQDDSRPEASAILAQLNQLADLIPAQWEYLESSPRGLSLKQENKPAEAGYEDFLAWRGRLSVTRAELRDLFSRSEWSQTLDDRPIASTDSEEVAKLRARLAAVETDLTQPTVVMAMRAAHRKALEFVLKTQP